jgi:TetR/AcrR family transcriptional regulator
VGQIADRNKGNIINSATKCYAAGKTTMREIAEEAGLPKANIHYYFKSANKVYEACVNQAKSIPVENRNDDQIALIAIHYIRQKEYHTAARTLLKQN